MFDKFQDLGVAGAIAGSVILLVVAVATCGTKSSRPNAGPVGARSHASAPRTLTVGSNAQRVHETTRRVPPETASFSTAERVHLKQSSSTQDARPLQQPRCETDDRCNVLRDRFYTEPHDAEQTDNWASFVAALLETYDADVVAFEAIDCGYSVCRIQLQMLREHAAAVLSLAQRAKKDGYDFFNSDEGAAGEKIIYLEVSKGRHSPPP
jgi:hypothetical protein